MKVEKIKSIKKIINNSKRYDIEVEKNHNFFANNILVHNCTIYPDGSCHARSLDSGYHVSRTWIKQFAANIGPQIDDKIFKKHWRITGENVYAKHSIHYHNLKSYFYMFGFWELDICLDWNYTRDVGAYHADYDPGWTRFWIEFERLESDAEEAKREGGKISKVKEVKNLLAKQLAKYVKEN